MAWGLGGAAIGVLGGLIGTCCSVNRAKSKAEKSFVLKCALGTWIGVILFVCGVFFLPKPYNHLLWGPYAVALSFGIRWMNQRQRTIIEENMGTQGD